MDEQHKPAALPVVPRLDRLDLLIQLIEQTHNKNQSNAPQGEKTEDAGDDDDDGYKPLSTALEEVHFKGTLMDRIALLEQRVLQLSLQIDEAGTSKSSVPEKTITNHAQSFRLQNSVDPPVAMQDTRREPSLVNMPGCGYKRWKRKTPKKSRRKLFEWLQISSATSS